MTTTPRQPLFCAHAEVALPLGAALLGGRNVGRPTMLPPNAIPTRGVEPCGDGWLAFSALVGQ